MCWKALWNIKDSMGNGSVIEPGDVQYMSAGTGVTHSEFNASKTEPLHLYQIWMFPEKKRAEAGLRSEKLFRGGEEAREVAADCFAGWAEGSVKIRQDNELYATVLGEGESVRHALKPERHAYVQVARGSVKLNGTELEAGDGAAITEEKTVELTGVENAEVLLFDLK